MNIDNIHHLYKNISEAVKWVERNDISTNEKKEALKKLKKNRRDCRTVHRSIQERPAAATYGESQVGKSYLIEHLLSVEGGRFTIKDPGTGREYEYLVEINPLGGGGESTGIVSRFTIEEVSIDHRYPIKVKLLSAKDIILFLMDSYFQDISNHDYVPDIEQINTKVKQIAQQYSDINFIQDYLDEDDIMEIYDYVNEHFQTGNIIVNHLKRSDFWETLSTNIKHMQTNTWVHVFSLVWGENKIINIQFSRLISELENLNFVSELFTNFEAVLNSKGTLLHVNRVKELNGKSIIEEGVRSEDYRDDCMISYVSKGAQVEKNIKKSILSTIAKELVFKADSELQHTKTFLKQTDLLDFPGARSRLEQNESDISELNFSEAILRGKVAYIFNKYSSERLITLLLIVHKNFQRTVAYLPILINNWIQNYIGYDESSRAYTLKQNNIPPLFFIYTFFNVDLGFNSIHDRQDNLENRWVFRFQTILNELVDTKNFNWLKQWTTNQPFFNNIYFLRSFDFSDKIYKGYSLSKKETGYAELESNIFSTMKEFQSELKRSFLNFPFVKDHFSKPEETWDEAASINKNGSEYIIRSLNQTDSETTRKLSYTSSIAKLKKDTIDIMSNFFEDGDADKIIDRKVTEVLNLQGYLNALISDRNNPFFFGDFIEALMLSEADVFNFFREQFENLDLVKATNIDRYLYFRTRSPRLLKVNTRDEKLIILKDDYKKDSIEETIRYFESIGLDLDVLFDMNRNTIKSASIKLSEDLKGYWFLHHLGMKEDEKGNLVQSELPESLNKFKAYGLDEDHIRLVLQNLAHRFNQIGILNDISDDLSEFVDNERAPNILELISDNGRARINNFINNFGWDKYNEDAKANLSRIVQSQNRDTLVLPRIPAISTPNEEGIMAALIASQQYALSAPVDQIKSIDAVPIVANTKRWIDFMQMSFLVDCETGKRDPEENRKLGIILDEIGNQNEMTILLES